MTQTLISCDGRINQFGICDKCHQPAQTTSSYCGRMLQTEQLHLHNVVRSAVFTPTCILRWKEMPIDFDPINKRKVLQQMWQGDMGEQDWRDIETVE